MSEDSLVDLQSVNVTPRANPLPQDQDEPKNTQMLSAADNIVSEFRFLLTIKMADAPTQG